MLIIIFFFIKQSTQWWIFIIRSFYIIFNLPFSPHDTTLGFCKSMPDRRRIWDHRVSSFFFIKREWSDHLRQSRPSKQWATMHTEISNLLDYLNHLIQQVGFDLLKVLSISTSIFRWSVNGPKYKMWARQA